MQPLRILETVLYVDDIDSAERFYTWLLGVQPLLRGAQRHVFYRLGSQMLLLFNPRFTTAEENAKAGLPVADHGGSFPGHVCFSIASEDYAAWLERLCGEGISIEHEHVWPGGQRSIYFRDPAGNSLELAEPGLWGLAQVL